MKICVCVSAFYVSVLNFESAKMEGKKKICQNKWHLMENNMANGGEKGNNRYRSITLKILLKKHFDWSRWCWERIRCRACRALP